jgi:hypothetical protein
MKIQHFIINKILHINTKKVCDKQRREGKLMEVIREQKEDEKEDERATESACLRRICSLIWWD